MSKTLKPGWHDYGNLSIFVDDEGYCNRGTLHFGLDYCYVRPYAPSPYGGFDAVSFKAYSGHHSRYFWR